MAKSPSDEQKNLSVLFKYGIVGLSQNGVGYLVYLLLVWLGLGPKTAVSVCYPIGALLSFWGNRRWTFSHQGSVSGAMSRFILSHIGGYFINLAMLYFFVDILFFPHELVQAFAIFFVAIYLFLMMRFFAFPKN